MKERAGVEAMLAHHGCARLFATSARFVSSASRPPLATRALPLFHARPMIWRGRRGALEDDAEDAERAALVAEDEAVVEDGMRADPSNELRHGGELAEAVFTGGELAAIDAQALHERAREAARGLVDLRRGEIALVRGDDGGFGLRLPKGVPRSVRSSAVRASPLSAATAVPPFAPVSRSRVATPCARLAHSQRPRVGRLLAPSRRGDANRDEIARSPGKARENDGRERWFPLCNDAPRTTPRRLHEDLSQCATLTRFDRLPSLQAPFVLAALSACSASTGESTSTASSAVEGLGLRGADPGCRRA